MIHTLIHHRPWYPWLIAFLCMCTVTVSNGLINSGITVFDESLLNEFGWSLTELKLRDSITFLGTSLMVLAAGWLIDRIGFKPLLLTGMALLAVCYFSYGYVDSLEDVYLLHFGFAMVAACAGNMAAIVTAANWVEHKKGLAIGMTIAGTSVGGMLIPPFANYLNQTFGWRQSLQIEALIPLGMLLLLFLLVRNKTKKEKQQSAEDHGMAFSDVLRTRQFYVIALAGACTYFAILALFSHMFLFMRSLDYEPQQAALALSTLAFSALSGKIICGWISDMVNNQMLFRVQMVTMLLGIIGISQFPQHIWFFLLLAGFGWGSLHTLYNYILITLFGLKDAGKINGSVSLAEAIGGGMGIFLTGLVHDKFGGYGASWNTVTLVMATGVVLIFMLRPTAVQLPREAATP